MVESINVSADCPIVFWGLRMIRVPIVTAELNAWC